MKNRFTLTPEMNRILFVRNLPLKISAKDMYEIFGKYGAIRQVRRGNTVETRGTAFVVYEDIFDAKNALEALNGYHILGRYLICLYFQPNKPLPGAAAAAVEPPATA